MNRAPRPIVITYHLVWTAYGWWLPNDPRGSMSKTIKSDVLTDLGELHHGRKRIQPASPEIRTFYKDAEPRLLHPLRTSDSACIDTIAEAFAETIGLHRYTCYAAAVMPDHVHVVIRKHKHIAEDMIQNFQNHSRSRLRGAGVYSQDHPVWGGPGWKVFLDHPDDVRRTVRYVQDNPAKAGRPRQEWGFVKVYDGWPLHPGHSPDSPYAKRLKTAERYTP
jgi:REP-associated tyrosine transposase